MAHTLRFDMIYEVAWLPPKNLSYTGLLSDLILNINRFLGIPTSKHKSLMSLQLIILCHSFHLTHNLLHSKQYLSVYGIIQHICIYQSCLPDCLYFQKYVYVQNQVSEKLLLVIMWFLGVSIEVSWETSGGLSFFENLNFLMVDLRDDFYLGDLLYSMSITNKLYDTNLLWSTCLNLIDPKVHYCIGREFLLLAPLVYVDPTKCKFFYFAF